MAVASGSPFRHRRDARPRRDQAPLGNLELVSAPGIAIRELQSGQAQEIERVCERVDCLARERPQRIAAPQELSMILF